MNLLDKNSFFFDLFEQNKISSVYDTVYTVFNNREITKNANKYGYSKKTKIHSFKFVPDYLSTTIANDLVCNKVFHKKGYAINLDFFLSVEDYIKIVCSTNFKKNVTRSIKRLETCFNITYKMFYGDIEDEEYLFLMNSLCEMIKKRFSQRTGRNRVIENWEYYLKMSQNLIVSKKASLFVIYQEKEPIEISLNFHYNSIMYSAISSYNIDYSKFSLGNIEIYKQLEWCLSNNIVLFDMGYGDLEYKKRWANLIYNFETHIISSPKSKLALLYRKYITYKYKTINYLISKNINNKIHQLKECFKINNENVKIKGIQYKTEPVNIPIAELNTYKNLTSQLSDTLSCIKKPIYDFLYANNVSLNDINIYQLKEELSIYIVVSKTNQLKIEITK